MTDSPDVVSLTSLEVDSESMVPVAVNMIKEVIGEGYDSLSEGSKAALLVLAVRCMHNGFHNGLSAAARAFGVASSEETQQIAEGKMYG